MSGGDGGEAGTKPGSSADLIVHAGYSNPRRRARAIEPQARPLSSMNQAFPSASLKNSTMNIPRQPMERTKLSTGPQRRRSTGIETQADDADPSGLSIRSRR